MHTTHAAAAEAAGRPPRSSLERTMMVTMAACALIVLAFMRLVIRETIPPMLAVSALGLILAALVRPGRRWVAVAAALYSLPSLALGGMLLRFEAQDVTDPAVRVAVPLLAAALLLLAAATTVAVRGFRRSPVSRRTPRWLTPAVSALAGLCLGVLTVSAVPRRGEAAGVSPDVLASLPTVETKNFQFTQPEVRVKAGASVALRLVNGDAASHSFDIDELGVHSPVPANGQAIALLKAERPGRYTIYCRPHYDKATHEGMKAVLVVE